MDEEDQGRSHTRCEGNQMNEREKEGWPDQWSGGKTDFGRKKE